MHGLFKIVLCSRFWTTAKRPKEINNKEVSFHGKNGEVPVSEDIDSSEFEFDQNEECFTLSYIKRIRNLTL